jgi:RHS repeat-associated protein
LGQTQSTTYDIIGNVLSTTDELGHTTSFGYDSLDRRTSITDSLGHISSTGYDTEGNVTSTTDALGNKTRYLYDADNRRIQVIDAKGGITKTGYDAVGNVDKITDSVNNVTSYTFDAVNRLITETNQLGKTRTRAYDAVGNQVEMVDRNGRKTAYSYDTLNQLRNGYDGTNTAIKTFTSVYDAVGHLLTSTNPDSKYSYTYDAIDRVTSIDNTGTAGVPSVKFSYAYDAVGNLLTVSDSISGNNAGITAYTYDLLNRVTRLAQSGTGVQSKHVEMAYNAVNQMTSLNRFSGNTAVAETSYIYDNNQRLIKLSHQKGANTIASYDYTFDDADKLSKTASSTDGTSNYNYDATNQLTGATHGNQADEAYQYDANGNRINAGYQTGANNQLLNDGTYTYEYDGEGNRTRRVETATGKVTEYVWDYRNRLSSVLFKNAQGAVAKTIDYLYDGDNQRIGKRIDGAITERYVLDRNQIALVFDGNSNQTHRYLYGTQIDQVLADEASTQTLWALGDNQGTIRDLIDNGGSLVEHLTYDSFGKIISTPITDFRYGYTGREQDSETGLDYYRARYYDAANGKFISEDPIGFEAGDGNLTRYVGNDSVNNIDPSGLIPNRGPIRPLPSIFKIGKDQIMNMSIKDRQKYLTKSNYFTSVKHSVLPMAFGIPVNHVIIPGWREAIGLAFPGRTQHVLKFMDYYFNEKIEGQDESSKTVFDLKKEGILDSIKSIPKISAKIIDFDFEMQVTIMKEIEKLKTKADCQGVEAYLTLSKTRDSFVNITSDNFALGKTGLLRKAEVILFRDGNGNVTVKNAGVKYKIHDAFHDVADLRNQTPDDPEELEGGIPYKIEGSWTARIRNYPFNEQIIQRIKVD